MKNISKSLLCLFVFCTTSESYSACNSRIQRCGSPSISSARQDRLRATVLQLENSQQVTPGGRITERSDGIQITSHWIVSGQWFRNRVMVKLSDDRICEWNDVSESVDFPLSQVGRETYHLSTFDTTAKIECEEETISIGSISSRSFQEGDMVSAMTIRQMEGEIITGEPLPPQAIMITPRSSEITTEESASSAR